MQTPCTPVEPKSSCGSKEQTGFFLLTEQQTSQTYISDSACVCVCLPSSVCMVGVIFVYVDMVCQFYGYSFLCSVGCFSMTIWTPTVLSVLYACILYFCIWTCSEQ